MTFQLAKMSVTANSQRLVCFVHEVFNVTLRSKWGKKLHWRANVGNTD